MGRNHFFFFRTESLFTEPLVIPSHLPGVPHSHTPIHFCDEIDLVGTRIDKIYHPKIVLNIHL